VFCESEHVYEDRTTDLSKKRHFVPDECIDANILQPDRVQHSRRCRKQARRRISFHGTRRCSLHADTADAAQISESSELLSISKGSTSRHDWIIEFDARQVSREIHGPYHNVGYNFDPLCL